MRYFRTGVSQTRLVTMTSTILLALGSAVFTTFFLLMFKGLYQYNPIEGKNPIYVAVDQFPRMQSQFVPDAIYRTWRSGLGRKIGIGAYQSPTDFVGNLGGTPERIVALAISPELTEMNSAFLGSGRSFTAGDIGQNHVIVSTVFWNAHYGREKFVYGRTLQMNHKQFDIVGVFRAGTIFPDILEQPDVLTCLAGVSIPGAIEKLHVLIENRTHLSPSLLREELSTLQLRALGHLPPWFSRYSSSMFLSLVPLRDDLNANRKRLLWMSSGIGLVILTLTATGTGCILFIHTITKRRDVCVRRILGASFLRAKLPLLKQAAATALIGVSSGIVLGCVIYAGIRGFIPESLFRTQGDFVSSRGIELLVLIEMLLAGCMCMVPLLPVANGKSSSLGELRTSQSTPTLKERYLFGAMLTMAVALTCMLSSITIQEVIEIEHFNTVSRGFAQDHIYIARFSTALLRNAGLDLSQFRDLVSRCLVRMPGVRGVATSGAVPGRAPLNVLRVSLPGIATAQNDPNLSVPVTTISENFTSMLKIPVIAGDSLTIDDSENAVLANETAAKQFFSDPRDAIGKLVSIPGTTPQCCRVIGVLRDFDNNGLGHATQPEFFLPDRNFQTNEEVLIMGLDRVDPYRTLRNAIARSGLSIPVSDVLSLKDDADMQLAPQRLLASLSIAFAMVALALAGAQIYAVVFFTLKRYRRDAAIRLSFGASRGRICLFFTRPLLISLGVGALVGVGMTQVIFSTQLTALGLATSTMQLVPIAAGATCTVAIAIFAWLLAATSFYRENLFAELKEE